ncbi:Uncharacterised protein [Mycobacteroides abscessus subsp. massiliense]|nr:Uncharacterised protein [Mycobacteroides abscessus subsp. massiliense]
MVDMDAPAGNVVKGAFPVADEPRDRASHHKGDHERDETQQKGALVTVHHVVAPPGTQPGHGRDASGLIGRPGRERGEAPTVACVKVRSPSPSAGISPARE